MSKTNKSKERGSADELEIMREIIKNDPFLLERVLTKIREVRNTAGRNLADVVAEKKGAKREEERRKGSGT
jgi:hypothetical protein